MAQIDARFDELSRAIAAINAGRDAAQAAYDPSALAQIEAALGGIGRKLEAMPTQASTPGLRALEDRIASLTASLGERIGSIQASMDPAPVMERLDRLSSRCHRHAGT
ncbi:MAG: hypothetical protein HC779_05835 [Phyllobacteriaceae bacterium]|nr:hypothetical protein [Phyllobacteriaceae bacterium]